MFILCVDSLSSVLRPVHGRQLEKIASFRAEPGRRVCFGLRLAFRHMRLDRGAAYRAAAGRQRDARRRQVTTKPATQESSLLHGNAMSCSCPKGRFLPPPPRMQQEEQLPLEIVKHPVELRSEHTLRCEHPISTVMRTYTWHALRRRFRHNPFVTGPPYVRSYCSTPLVASNGAAS